MNKMFFIAVIALFSFNKGAYSQPNKYAINALVMINGESGERLILKKEKLQVLDSLELYSEDGKLVLCSFRFTATFPGGISDWVSDSNLLTEEMKDTLSFLKRNGFVLLSEFVIKDEYGVLIKPYYDSIYIQVVD